MTRASSRWIWAVPLLSSLALAGCEACRGQKDDEDKPPSGQVYDEARRVRRTSATFPAADEDYFHDMDGGIALTPGEIRGRNAWIVWSGGDDLFWDDLSRTSLGTVDLLKTISSHPSLRFSRDNRWDYLGLVNEPCFEKATGPDPDRYGLWLDKRRADCPLDPFENEAKYPGVAIGARGKNVAVGSFYGAATGVVGLRLFPNPAFDAAAEGKWNAKDYYEKEEYYASKELVRPYRVGMSCAFCHVGPSPTKPPADPENPQWENLSSVVGTQYFWVDRILDWKSDETSFPQQLFRTSRPGTLDTSLISTDNINNPRTMNAFYGLPARLEIAKRWGRETLSGGELDNKQLNDYVQSGPLTEFFQKPSTVLTPRVLKDGSDSVGAIGALNRVYLNIGLYSEEWLRHFNALVGGKRTSPIAIAVAEKNSVYWQATEAMTPDMSLFFLKGTDGHRLADAPGGEAFLTKDKARLARGKVVFAERCARCHSSKIPRPAPALDESGGCAGPGYLECWNKYWAWTKTAEFKREMTKIVAGLRLPEGQLPLDRPARADHAARDERLQPARDERAAGRHLGQLRLDLLQGAALGRDDQGARSVYRAGARLRDARRRPGLHAAALAHQRLVDRAVPGQQQPRAVRPVTVGRGADGIVRSLDRAAALAREAREGQRARRQGAGQDRPHHGQELPARAGRLSPRPAAAALRSGAARLPEARQGERHRDRADPRGHADQPARERGPDAAAGREHGREGRARREGGGARGQDQEGPVRLAAGRDERPGQGRVQGSRRAAPEPQQLPGLRREPRPLLRHQPLQGGAGPQRRRTSGRSSSS